MHWPKKDPLGGLAAKQRSCGMTGRSPSVPTKSGNPNEILDHSISHSSIYWHITQYRGTCQTTNRLNYWRFWTFTSFIPKKLVCFFYVSIMKWNFEELSPSPKIPHPTPRGLLGCGTSAMASATARISSTARRRRCTGSTAMAAVAWWIGEPGESGDETLSHNGAMVSRWRLTMWGS